MALSKKSTEDYQKILKKELNLDLSYEETSVLGEKLKRLANLLFKFKQKEDQRKEKPKDLV
jgi:hypothetical protein